MQALKYKQTNIPWIGEIPEDWEVRRLKMLTNIKRWASPRPIDDQKYFDENWEFAWVRISDVTASNIYLEKTEQQLSELWASLSVKQYPGDLFLSIAGTVGKPIFAKIKCCIHDGFVTFQSLDKQVNRMFLFHILHSGQAYFWLWKEWSQLNLNIDTVGNISIPLPPFATQTAIVNFLDQKTEQISTLLSNKKALINLLKEQKQSIIHQAVTKGTNKNAKMKDSGIPWIGQIPEDWKVAKIKQIVSTKITDWPHETPELLLEWVPFASVESVYDGKINFESIRWFISKEQDEIYSQKCKPQRNDIFIVKSWSTTGKIAVLEEDRDFNIWSPLALVRVKEALCEYKFIYYFFISESFQKQIQTFWSFGTQPNIGMWVIENLHTTLPPLKIQRAIIKYIEEETSQIDSAIKKIEQEIILIEEYQTSLIYQAVTGKISIS